MVGVREESDEISELFKSDPVTYRVDRRSALKMKLRRALSEKLTVFLSSFADETLVEYVIVLLCNGKDQYQARKDLVDFLADSTESFVAWLWDFLSRKIDAVEKSGHTTSSCKRTEVQRPSNELRAHAGNASLVRPQDNEGPAEQSKYYAGSRETSNNLVLRLRNLQEGICGGVTHERSLALEEDLHERVTPRRSLRNKKIEEDPPISKPRGISSLGFVGGPYSPCLENGWHYKKGEKAHDSTRPSTSFERPRSEVVAIGRKSKSSNKEVLRTKHSKKLPKLAMDKELKPVQRNVWDRLGKPQNEPNNPFRERTNSLLVPTATVPPIDPLVTQNLPSALPLLPHAQEHFVSTCLYPEEVVKTSSICTPMVIVNKLKRQFEQIESHLLASAVTSKSRERVPAKQRLGISVGAPQLLPVGNCFSSNMAKEEPALVEIGFKPEIVCNAESVNSEQRPPITLTKEKALENSESGNSSEEPPSKVAHMKVKLEEMENDMQELRTKHANLENLKSDSETNPSSGAQPSQMEDMDSRTVLVTNVHFGATKEAIVSHFAKCGPVTKVIILRDTITGKPKGAACIVFTKKDSVEKAISLSGTSLFSRTLKVMRKVDAPAGLLEQPHSLQLFPPSWNSLHRYPMTTHLQWRRETYPSVSNLISTPKENGLGLMAIGPKVVPMGYLTVRSALGFVRMNFKADTKVLVQILKQIGR